MRDSDLRLDVLRGGRRYGPLPIGLGHVDDLHGHIGPPVGNHLDGSPGELDASTGEMNWQGARKKR